MKHRIEIWESKYRVYYAEGKQTGSVVHDLKNKGVIISPKDKANRWAFENLSIGGHLIK
jgi:hypothetical protein